MRSAPAGARQTPTVRASTWTTTGTSASPSWRTRRTTSSTSDQALGSPSSKQSASEVKLDYIKVIKST